MEGELGTVHGKALFVVWFGLVWWPCHAQAEGSRAHPSADGGMPGKSSEREGETLRRRVIL